MLCSITMKQSVQCFQDTPMDLIQYLQPLLGFELSLHLPLDQQQKLLTTLAAIPEVPSVSEQSLLPPIGNAPKEMEMPKEINISIMPDPEPPADLYLSKSKKFSSPKKRFQVSLDVHFTQYRPMTKQYILKKAAMETCI